MKLLIVEDEKALSDAIVEYLTSEGYGCETALNFWAADEKVALYDYDCVLVDISLPDGSGFEVIKELKKRKSEAGIIIISAKDTSQDRITGLKLGADDYLVKPFNLEELLLRIQNIHKRSSDESIKEIDIYQFGNNQINFATYEVNSNSGPLRLTKKEVLLLKLLIERQNEVVSRQQILQTVWGYDIYPSTRTIDNFILSFRKYFEINPREPKHFHSIRGVGYKFIP